jgi:ribosomal-protein-alanine N-acetyltransferase
MGTLLGPPVTRRLILVPVTPLMKLAMQSSPAAFAGLTGVTLPEGWPEFPQAFSDCVETSDPWHGYLFVRRDESLLVGNGGFVGPPDEAGQLEIGYEIAPSFRNSGYAAEAASGLIGLAFAHGARAVIAHSLPWPNASTAVMQKLGMKQTAEIAASRGKVWRWILTNPRLRGGERTAVPPTGPFRLVC